MEKKNYFAFAEMLLVGLLVFGLVSGAGYNIVVPSTTPPADTSSPGGGGGGGSGAGATTYTISDADFLAGYTKEIFVNDKFRITVENETHDIKLTELTNITATINVTSEIQIATLLVGDIRKFEVTGDNIYDILIILNSINATSSKVNLTVQKTTEEITPESKAGEAKKESDAQGEKEQQQQNEQKKKSLYYFLAIVGVILIAFVIYFVIKKKKK
ncbi:MAG: hypothetical protein KJ949_03020 [Nanoarchaeota archaeon]|nr:hypothetical protein [Nanoarchaeota archaeon]